MCCFSTPTGILLSDPAHTHLAHVYAAKVLSTNHNPKTSKQHVALLGTTNSRPIGSCILIILRRWHSKGEKSYYWPLLQLLLGLQHSAPHPIDLKCMPAPSPPGATATWCPRYWARCSKLPDAAGSCRSCPQRLSVEESQKLASYFFSPSFFVIHNTSAAS